MDLIFKASKYSYFLLFMLSLPILICCGFVMEVWLGIVPSYTVSFCRLMLLFMLVDSAAAPLWTSVQATGKIRNYQIMIGCLVLTNLPLAYTALCLGMSPVCVFVIRLLVNIIVFTVRLIYLGFKIDLPILKYTIQVINENIICDYFICSSTLGGKLLLSWLARFNINLFNCFPMYITICLVCRVEAGRAKSISTYYFEKMTIEFIPVQMCFHLSLLAKCYKNCCFFHMSYL